MIALKYKLPVNPKKHYMICCPISHVVKPEQEGMRKSMLLLKLIHFCATSPAVSSS